MKLKTYVIAVLTLLTLSFGSTAQIFEPVKWKFSSKVLNEKEAEVVASCTIEDKWHVYALTVSNKPDAIGPIPTTLKLDASKSYSASGKTTEGKYITHFDPNFEMDLNYFEKSATFKQKITINSDKPFKVTGVLEYMSCNDERCIFPDPELFEVTVTPMATEGATADNATTPDTAVPTNTNTVSESGHVTWVPTVKQISENEYELILTANSEPGWHIYAQKLESTEGPVPTSFSFVANSGYQLNGTVAEGTPKREYSKEFLMNVDYFEGNAQFVQKIKLTSTEKPTIEGSVQFMQCNAETCLPPKTKNFKFNLATLSASEFDPLANVEGKDLGETDPFKMKNVDLNAPINNCGQEKEDYSLWAIFIFGLLGGLLALLTPCVFPMIPLTVSFFTKGAEKANGKSRAVIYGLFILLIYFLLSLPFHLSKNVDPAVLNSIATNVWLNIGFFIVFVVFAMSFFGYFEITLPSGLANKVDSASNVGGLIGIFFMALTLAIVSFSCTGPILGSVIGSIYSSDDVTGIVSILGLELSLPAAKVSSAMIGFGIALGAPFALFAAFPSLLKKLPKSGGWMDDFKVSLGFLELALAVKFLSNADLVKQWHLVPREVFFGIWIILGILWVAYLLGLYKFKPGQGSKGMSTTKWLVACTVLLVTLRFIPGVLNNEHLGKMKFLSGFPPPWTYSLYDRKSEFETHNNQFEEVLKLAREENKPVFLDFTGWACVNCRKMEDNIWPEPEVRPILDSNFVMCSLYVDEKVELPLDQQFIYETKSGRKKRIKDVGDLWATLQTETFENNSQPFYVLLTPDGQLLSPTSGYNDDPEKYAEWLRCGLDAFQKWKAEAANH
jgi:thiol:disulfide interchange protein